MWGYCECVFIFALFCKADSSNKRVSRKSFVQSSLMGERLPYEFKASTEEELPSLTFSLFDCLPVCLFARLLVSKSRNLSLNKLSANFNWRFLSAKTQKPLIRFHLWKIMTTKLMGSIGFKQFSHQSWFLIIT